MIMITTIFVVYKYITRPEIHLINNQIYSILVKDEQFYQNKINNCKKIHKNYSNLYELGYNIALFRIYTGLRYIDIDWHEKMLELIRNNLSLVKHIASMPKKYSNSLKHYIISSVTTPYLEIYIHDILTYDIHVQDCFRKLKGDCTDYERGYYMGCLEGFFLSQGGDEFWETITIDKLESMIGKNFQLKYEIKTN